MNEMHQTYMKIKNYESDESCKKFKDILKNKSSRDEWKNPILYSFKLKQTFEESQVVNFVGFQDLQLKQGKNGIDLDKSIHYYAIQIVQNHRLLLKICRKVSILKEFLKQIKEDVKNDMNLQKQISFQEDYCEIILKEIDLYRFHSQPKERIVESQNQNPLNLSENMENYSIQNVQQRMSIFFQLYQKFKANKKVLNFQDQNQPNLRFSKETYLRIIHIIINSIITFTDYSKKIEITFLDQSKIEICILFHDDINRKDEKMFKNLLNIEDSFEYLVNKIQSVVDNPFNYHKEPQDQQPEDKSVIFTITFSKSSFMKQKIQNDNYSFQEYNNFGNQENSNQYRNNNHKDSTGGQYYQLKDKNNHLHERTDRKEHTFNGTNYEQNLSSRPLHTNYT